MPGAIGCTDQACAFRDLHDVLLAADASFVYGISTQTTELQAEAKGWPNHP